MNKYRKASIGGTPKYFTLLRNWAHQGYFYLDKTEMIYRTIWEIVPVLIINYFLNFNLYVSVFISFIIIHTYNWIVNDNFWAVIIHSLPNQKNPGEELTIKYLLDMQKRLLNANSITGIIIYGSVSRNKWHERSDIDIRFLRKKGVISGFSSYILLRKERFIALLLGQPLDSYVADSVLFLRKMRKDEFPIFLKNSDKRLFEEYNIETITDFSIVNSLNNIN